MRERRRIMLDINEDAAELCDEYADREWTERGRKQWRDLARKFRNEKTS